MKKIHIDDLSEPFLTEPAREALSYTTRNPASLLAEAVFEAAQRITGLGPLNSESYLERLERYLREARSDASLTPLGRTIRFQECVRNVCTRLRLDHLLKRSPKIDQTPIKAPIVIVGLERSGSTYLHGLMAADSRLRALRMKDLPDPLATVIGKNQMASGYDYGISRPPGLEYVLPHLRSDLLPHFRAMYPFEPDDPATDWHLRSSDFPVADAPSQRPRYEYMKTMLKALQWARGEGRWVLMSHEYCAQLRSLITSFPDATIVFTHRDAFSSTISWATMRAYISRLSHAKVDVASIMKDVATRTKSMLQARARDRQFLSGSRVVDVRFSELMSDELDVVEKIYDSAGMDLPDAERERIRLFIASHGRHRHGKVVYDPADFHVSEDVIQSLLGPDAENSN